ncbi:hypothetical protein GALMADRAFT_215272 [Galerina marginata CBS 339.88]|uniref:BTB domain-containing protein n=1 Tax=Galerina marginata (strain CBS 339.88) TaxID=685588 RepID=A0A067SED9_GALM3|nr:hypothetical protein GALMADRAFT_215272 [Galerina marginata CBS 339.88]
MMDAKKESVLISDHPIYWFEDGSLVLDVEVQRFRVHRTLLSRHSRFFSMLELGLKGDTTNGSRERNKEEETPISALNRHALNHVVLEPKRQVRAQDVEVLLQHLYHDVSLGNDSSVAHVASLLRVSSPQQLDFPNIHKSARAVFEGMFPKGPDAFTHNHPLHDALPVATEFKLLSVRKAILYSLVSTTDFDVSGSNSGDNDPQYADTLEILNGASTPRDDQPERQPNVPLMIEITGTETIPDTSTPSEPSLPRKVLSPADAEICMTLMTRLISHFTPILFTPAATPHMACTDVFAETWMPLVIQPAIENDGVYKPLETLQRMKKIDWAELGLCALCVEDKRAEWAEEQSNIWNLMDSWLLPPAQVDNV